MKEKQKYVEPRGYFTPEMLKAAEEYDRLHELEKQVDESNEEAKKED